MKRNPVVLAMKVGNIGEPTTLFSVRPSPLNWVCFWRTRSPRCADNRPIRTNGIIKTWMMKKRGIIDAGPRELAAPEEGHQVAADEGDRLGDGVPDAQARCPK